MGITTKVLLIFPRRIADLNIKLHGILNLLSRPDTEADTISFGVHSSPCERFRAQPSHERYVSQPEPGHTIPASIPSSFNSTSPLGLSNYILQHLLDEYRKRQAYFPFVIVLDEWNPTSMAAERPFLLLAVITCASSQRPHLQAALAEEFRKTLAARIIVDGERNLDLLQGLLVHLSWYTPK
jgi:hypothetical protein